MTEGEKAICDRLDRLYLLIYMIAGGKVEDTPEPPAPGYQQTMIEVKHGQAPREVVINVP